MRHNCPPLFFIIPVTFGWPIWNRIYGGWGFTKFALRLYGEMVEHDFQIQSGTPVQFGQMIGWIEGFKATSDLDSLIDGQFLGGNPALREQLKLLTDDPYGAGWLYQGKGQPDPHCVDVRGYVGVLDSTIDQLLPAPEQRPNA